MQIQFHVPNLRHLAVSINFWETLASVHWFSEDIFPFFRGIRCLDDLTVVVTEQGTSGRPTWGFRERGPNFEIDNFSAEQEMEIRATFDHLRKRCDGWSTTQLKIGGFS
jgi:hypothetical protein